MISVNATNRIRRLFQLGRSARPVAEFQNQCSFRPQVESLETRSLPSASPLSLTAALIGALAEPASHLAAARVEVEVHAAATFAPSLEAPGNNDSGRGTLRDMSAVALGQSLVIDVVLRESSAVHSNGRMVGQSFSLDVAVGPSRESMSMTASIGSRPIGAPPVFGPPAIEVVGKSEASTPPADIFARQTASSLGFGDFIPVVNAANAAAAGNFIASGTATGSNTAAPTVQNSVNPVEFSGTGGFFAGSKLSNNDSEEELEARPDANRPSENNSTQEPEVRSSTGVDVEVAANTAWFVQQALTDDDMTDPDASGDPAEANDPALSLELAVRGAALAVGLGLVAVRTSQDSPTRAGVRSRLRTSRLTT